jgi:hypothetical protein
MPARSARRPARERVMKTMIGASDRMIPPDETAPLRGPTFRDREDQAAEVRRAVLPTPPEGRAALGANARVEEPGRCPPCGSDRVYLEAREASPEVLGPDGPVPLAGQHCRCRARAGSFPPSGPWRVAAGGRAADARGRGAAGAGGGRPRTSGSPRRPGR